MSCRSSRGTVRTLVLALFALCGCGKDDIPAPATTLVSGPVTFSRDIAPLVFEHCAECHRPQGAGPFPLLTYDDVRRRANQIATVTGSGFMPPWLPEPAYGQFVGERRLSPEQIEMLRHWAEQGALEGDPTEVPARPQWTEGWQLGEPDLILTLPEPYTLAAEGPDVFRNFVVSIPVSGTRYVRAVELHPGRKQVVHHAIVMVDPQGGAARLDAEDPEPGYDGMDSIYGHAPDGHFLGWTPGKVADPGEGDLPCAWIPGPTSCSSCTCCPAARRSAFSRPSGSTSASDRAVPSAPSRCI